MTFGASLESFVVVGVSSAAVLNSVFVVVIMNHFVEQGSAYIFDWSCKRSCADVDFVRVANGRNPCVIIEGEMTVSFRGGLNGDGRS